MSAQNPDPKDQNSQQSESGPNNIVIGAAMAGFVGVLMLIGYLFR